MNAPSTPASRPLWTCPFCPLLCDGLTVDRGSSAGWAVGEGACPHATRGLARFGAEASLAQPQRAGVDCTLDDAVDAAARLLAASRQPLFGGLGTDVAGARSLYRLACRTGAICDASGGDAAMHVTRARQDKGGYFTTLAEMRTRADLIVCLGGVAAAQGTSFFDRIGVGEALVDLRHVVVVGPRPGDDAVLALLSKREGVSVETVPLAGDLFDTVAALAAVVAGHAHCDATPALRALGDRLKAAHYAVLVGEGGLLPVRGTLIVEAVNQVVATLNRTTRAANFWIGGGDGAGTTEQVFTWLSGLPLRSRAGPRGLEHEPVCFDAARLVADASVDAGLWISAFDADDPPPGTAMPWIVIGHPDLSATAAAVFIPVSTPGIGSTGHLFRSDGGVVLPLTPLYDDRLPTVADVIARIDRAMANRSETP